MSWVMRLRDPPAMTLRLSKLSNSRKERLRIPGEQGHNNEK